MKPFALLRRAAALAALPTVVLAAGGRPVSAAEPIDNDELVAASEFQGLPDKDSHSGVFLDLIGVGSSSVTQPNAFGIVLPASTPSLRIAIFDGNDGGQWDQNKIANDDSGNPVPDESVVEYDLVTASPSFPETVVTTADSETLAPRPGISKMFMNAVDSRWEFLYDGPHHPNALTIDGGHLYKLVIHYRLPTPVGAGPINGYKVAVNGPFGLIPLVRGETLTAGFIGGVVDSRNLRFVFPPSPTLQEFSTSRDHYPDMLKPIQPDWNTAQADASPFKPAVRFNPATDTFSNKYNGTFTLPLRLIPRPGQTWAEFVGELVLEEGDADDFDDVSGIGPDGTPSPMNPGIPPDQGRRYIGALGIAHDNTYYGVPVIDPSQLTPESGSPWLELIDPSGAVRATLTDLSGNVADEDTTGSNFEKIPVPLDGIPGFWTLRIHDLDARNSWFVRTNASFVPVTQRLDGRVYADQNCDGDDELDTDPGLAGIEVTIQRTDVAAPPILATTDATGAWSVDPILPGTYDVFVTPGQPALDAFVPNPTPSPIQIGIDLGHSVRDVDLGYCKKECECQSGKVHELCLEASIWLADPATRHFDVYVKLDRGCCECGCREKGNNGVGNGYDPQPPGNPPINDGKGTSPGSPGNRGGADPEDRKGDPSKGGRSATSSSGCEMADLDCFSFDGEFRGEQKGRNGLITVKSVRVVDGYAKVLVCLDANCPYFPEQYFDGKIHLEVTVNGVGEAFCSTVDCHCLSARSVFPCDWKPLWCGDVPDFFVASFVPWECVPHEPCKPPPCTPPPPPCEPKPPKCDKPPTCEPKPPKCEPKPPPCEPKPPKCEPKPPKCEPKPPVCEKPPKCDEKPKCEKPKDDCQDKQGKQVKCDGKDKGEKCKEPKDDCKDEKPKPKDDCGCKPKGNNGVGNGYDPQPPGNPRINDGKGTSPGSPGNRGGK